MNGHFGFPHKNIILSASKTHLHTCSSSPCGFQGSVFSQWGSFTLNKDEGYKGYLVPYMLPLYNPQVLKERNASSKNLLKDFLRP